MHQFYHHILDLTSASLSTAVRYRGMVSVRRLIVASVAFEGVKYDQVQAFCGRSALMAMAAAFVLGSFRKVSYSACTSE